LGIGVKQFITAPNQNFPLHGWNFPPVKNPCINRTYLSRIRFHARRVWDPAHTLYYKVVCCFSSAMDWGCIQV